MDAARMVVPVDSPSSPTHDYVPQIFGLLVVAVFFLFLLHVLGSLRRMTSHKLLHVLVSGTYTLSYSLVSYTLGLMNSSENCVDVFPVWAVCLLLLLGSTDSLAVRSLSDIDNWRSFYIKHLFKGVLVVYIFVYVVAISPESRYFQAPLWIILFIIVLRSYGRMASMRMASRSYLLSNSVKPIADHMQYEHEQRAGPYDPVTMEGYRYIVMGEHSQTYSVKLPTYVLEHDDKAKNVNIITVEKVYRCTGILLRSDRGLRLKDLCLSMALAKMLNRRFSGFKLAEVHDLQTRDFLFRGLLAGAKPYDRAFRIIEEEIAFVHDLYYTRYPYHYHKGLFSALYLPIAMVILCSWLSYLLFHKNKHYGHLDNVNSTVFIMAVVTFLEVFQLYLHLASRWFKVELIRAYLTRLEKTGRFLHMIIRILLSLKGIQPWQQKLGQYSLLEKFKCTTRISNCFYYLTLCLVDKAKKGLKKGKPVKLSRHVKGAVLQTLKDCEGRLTNGVTSLRRNGVLNCEQLISWACDARRTEATHTILIWHIATTLCKHEHDERAKEGHVADLSEEDAAAIEVASSMSQYCAYLVAFAPDLLPDHSSTSSLILDESVKQARELLSGDKTMKSWYKKLMILGNGGGEASVVELGARLAMKLIEDYSLDPATRWKVLSDFWCEMVLYVAPSDDARAHLEAMAKGGEFVTHLWALLTHGGVLNRDMKIKLRNRPHDREPPRESFPLLVAFNPLFLGDV